eukprot:NODE_1943_length_862_cov_286.166052_g1361_i0.p1 GENE.NODE_1943_length_862_cov_286.166052_g1361_i0~~NODE_1943_length_862_cov_286.166052_g1361_i0.p1  ORF type:complete len:219 (+),score=82.67 NODE_1943_length_862_cov_286.166052_g1361_i0:63-719(+)
MASEEYIRYRASSLDEFGRGRYGAGATNYSAALAGARSHLPPPPLGAGAGASFSASSHVATSNFGGGWNFLQYSGVPATALPRGPMMTAPVWRDDLVLSETHYHHGDHHHNHHQRHVHHFHDLHLLGSASETLDLRGNPAVHTQVIPSENPPQLKFRPDVLGRQAFEQGASQYFGSLSQRFDTHTAAAGGANFSAGLPTAGMERVTEEEVETRRRYVS